MHSFRFRMRSADAGFRNQRASKYRGFDDYILDLQQVYCVQIAPEVKEPYIEMCPLVRQNIEYGFLKYHGGNHRSEPEYQTVVGKEDDLGSIIGAPENEL